MQTSRKGTRLNEVQYFRQPLPHARKMMTAIRVIPRTSELHVNPLFVTESLAHDKNFKIIMRTKERSKQLDARQRSIEMALLMGTSESSVLDDRSSRSRFREIYVETDRDLKKETLSPPYEIPKYFNSPECNLNALNSIENVADSLIDSDFEKRGKYGESLMGQKDHKIKAFEAERKQTHPVSDSGFKQALQQFFALITGKRSATPSKNKKSPSQDGYYFFGISINRILRSRRKKDSMRTRRNHRVQKVGMHTEDGDRACIVNGICKENVVCKKTGSKKSEEKVASMLVRQIQRTRDKNLRVALLEQELRARLPEEDDRYGGRILNEKLPPRQLSSPLC